MPEAPDGADGWSSAMVAVAGILPIYAAILPGFLDTPAAPTAALVLTFGENGERKIHIEADGTLRFENVDNTDEAAQAFWTAVTRIAGGSNQENLNLREKCAEIGHFLVKDQEAGAAVQPNDRTDRDIIEEPTDQTDALEAHRVAREAAEKAWMDLLNICVRLAEGKAPLGSTIRYAKRK